MVFHHKLSKRKSPGQTTGALTMLTSQAMCADSSVLSRLLATAGHGKAALRQLPVSVYLIASLLPGAAAFLTSFSSRIPSSYVAPHADSSSSTGNVKPR
jgi:hypothetical protein